MIQEPQRNPQHQVTVATGKASKSSPRRPVRVIRQWFPFFSFYTLMMGKNLSRSESLHVKRCVGIYKIAGWVHVCIHR